MKLAQFKSLDNYPLTLYYEPEREKYTDMVRMTEYVEVEFPPRAPEEIVPAQIAALDEQIADVSREFGAKLAALKEAEGESVGAHQSARARMTCPNTINDRGTLCGDEGRLCDACSDEMARCYAYLRHTPRHQVFNDQQAKDEYAQELRDAGRGHLCPPI